MAAQMEGPGQLQEALEILRRRWWQISIPTLIALSLGIAAAVIVPKKFEVSTQVELRELFLDDGLRRAARDQTQGVAYNAPDQLLSPKRIKDVLETLEVPEFLTADAVGKAEFVAHIRENLRVIAPRKPNQIGSSFVTIEFKDINSEFAQRFLKALTKAWIEQVVERERTRHDVEYQKLQTRQHELDKEFEIANRELTDLRNENDISPTQPTPGRNAVRLEDPAILRFEDNSKRKDVVHTDLAAAREALLMAREQLAETDPEVPTTRVTEGQDFQLQLEALRQQIIALEGQLDGVRPAHPRYQQVTRKLNELDAHIAELELHRTDERVSQDFMANPAYLTLEALVKQSELDVGRLEAEKESLRKLLDSDRVELRNLREAYNRDAEISSRVDRIRISMADTDIKLLDKRQRRDVIYGPAGNPFQIIQDVEPPSAPTEPNPLLIITISVILGLGVGLASAILAEFSRSCFRNAPDLHRVLAIPVLGVIGPIVTRLERRRKRVRRAAVGSLCLVSMTCILFLTWAWAYQPDLLGTRINDGIEELRKLFI